MASCLGSQAKRIRERKGRIVSRDGDVPPTMDGARPVCGRGILTPRHIMLIPFVLFEAEP